MNFYGKKNLETVETNQTLKSNWMKCNFEGTNNSTVSRNTPFQLCQEVDRKKRGERKTEMKETGTNIKQRHKYRQTETDR